jgi:hypothetical protein
MDLLRAALEEGRTLVESELALARKELGEAAHAGLVAGVASAVAGAFGLLAVALLLVGTLLAFRVGLAASFFAAGWLIAVAAAVAAFLGIRALPKRPLQRTRERLETDVRDLKGHLT